MSRDNQVLVLGMSHVEALHRAAPDFDLGANAELRVINLNSSPKIYNQALNELNLEPIKRLSPSAIFLSLGGNFHNIFSLVENPVPFTLGDEKAGAVLSPEDKKRIFVPLDMLRHHFRNHLADRFFKHLATFKDHLPDIPMYHLCSPPPVADEAHINRFPGIFRVKLGLDVRGISPKPLRVAIYNLHSELYRKACEEHGIEFVSPPTETSDNDGALQPQFYNNDPTHGNAAYGALVLKQISERMEGLHAAA